MVRRLAIACLPALAAGVILALVIGSESGRPRATPIAAHARSPRAEPPLPAAPNDVRGSAARRMPIPILMYHVVANRPPGSPYPGLWVRPRVFGAQMAALRRAGYWAISLGQAWRAWTRGGPLPRTPVVVSFDDGYLGDYTHARPVLRRLGWPGVLNLELDNVRPGDLDARQLRALIADGWEIDSHTIDHPDLTKLGGRRLAYELVASRRELERRFGVRADFFCYPYGRYDASVERAVARAGYRAATTEDDGYATAATPFALPRVRVQGGETPAELLARLRAERPRS
jgi:peptidoglycan/xylan/chitin deacetylase (PgdA/CDA1 family)